jgi:hypothetical protein
VWALVQHGQMPYDAAADLLGVPAVEVARILTSTLRQEPDAQGAFVTG